jgi:hypothetical protein
MTNTVTGEAGLVAYIKAKETLVKAQHELAVAWKEQIAVKDIWLSAVQMNSSDQEVARDKLVKATRKVYDAEAAVVIAQCKVDLAGEVLPELASGSGSGSGSGSETPNNNEHCKFLKELKLNIQEIDKSIDAFIVQSLNVALDAMESFENVLDVTAVQKKNILINLLTHLNKGSKQLIGNDIWSVSDVEFVSKTLSEILPKTVKLVNTALLDPILRLPHDALHTHLESYTK